MKMKKLGLLFMMLCMVFAVNAQELKKGDKLPDFHLKSAVYGDVSSAELKEMCIRDSGGARRDEEKSRAKERIFSFRDRFHQWDPKNQRPELWDIYNAKIHKGESIRVFPLSNWTELDIWQYIRLENIPIVPLYFAKERPVVNIDGNLIMADDDRLPEEYRDRIEMKKVRFRTLGCWPLTGAVESDADTIEKIVEEMMTTTKSERTTRVIDFDQDASMEQKKREGYF